jgi:hypothetical protein
MVRSRGKFGVGGSLHFRGTPVHANTINEVVDGPVSAENVCVIYGDARLVEASPWPQQTIEVYV